MDRLDTLLPDALKGHPLLAQALTHISAGVEQGGHNERLEFLGDAVIGLAVARRLYLDRPGENEGGMSRLRAMLVSRAGLAAAAVELGLGERLLLSRKAAERGESGNERILASAVEALAGAAFLACGWEAAMAFIDRVLDRQYSALPDDSREAADPKTRLQELMHARHLPRPEYQVARDPSSSGHGFTVVCVAGKRVGIGDGETRRAAEIAAARDVLEKLVPSTQATDLRNRQSMLGSERAQAENLHG